MTSGTACSARILVDDEVVAVEAAGHRWAEWDRFDRLVMPRGTERGAGLAAAVGGVGEHLQAGFLIGEELDTGRAVRSVGGVIAAAVMSPVSGSTAMWAL